VGGLTELTVPFAGTVLRVAVAPGDVVPAGAVLLVIESMKMEHVFEAAASGKVDSVAVSAGDAVQAGDVLVRIDESRAPPVADAVEGDTAAQVDVTVRPELAELRARVATTLDDGRPAATERRHAGA
jgi:pyruvate/2-oxoglutarate dehydrogenase complex dihydrolipoamide acyltransferase (E2) component